MTGFPLAFVIEDYMDQAIVFSKALEMAGYRVETILDGAAAKQRLNEVTPALIVLDLHIPKVTGEMLLQQIRSEERFRQTRVVLATADNLLAERLRPMADLTLLKPISFVQLNQLAQRLLTH
ncbi:MAG: response regulator [Longilinea sp.]|nr:response regulator [Longilinea sp.]